MKERIGIYRLKQAKTFTRTYECAAWHTDIEVPPGDYEIFAEVDPDGECKDFPGLSCTLPGVITSSAFPSLFCGNRIPGTDPNVNKDVGKPDTYGWFSYAHAIAHMLLQQKAGWNPPEHAKNYYNSFEIILDEGFAATYINFEYDGEKKQTAAIVKTSMFKGPIVLEKLVKEEACQF